MAKVSKRIRAATKGLNPEAIGRARMTLGEGITGWAARERRTLAVAEALSILTAWASS